MNTSLDYQTFQQAAFFIINKPLNRDFKVMDKEQFTILVVEDEPISQRVAQLALESMDYRVDIAVTGRQALELFVTNNYVAILMDMGLPDTTGIEITKKIREIEQEKGRHTPIIALTAHGELARKNCLEAGMDDFSTKPLEIEHLRALLKSWIEKSH